MNSLFTVLKTNIINDWGLNTFSKTVTDKKQKKKAFYSLFAMVGGAIAIAYIVTVYSLLMAGSLEKVGFLELIIVMGLMVSILVTLFSSIYKAQGSLFSAKDYDLLMSLPVKPNVIFASKLINLLLLNWVFTLFAVLPPTIIYSVKMNNISLGYFLILTLSILFIPLIPTIVAALTSIIISYFASKFRYKNLTTILGTLILFVAIMIGSFKMQDIMKYVFVNATSIIDGVGRIYPPIAYLTTALVEVNFIEFFKFIVVSIIPFILFIIGFSKIFTLINQRLGENFKKANYKMTSLKASKPIIALTKKEIKRYLSTPVYVLNTAISMLIAVGGAIATLFIDAQTLAMYMEIPYIDGIFPLVILGTMIFCIGLATTTCSSISLEGNNLWIVKSLPIEVKDIFIGKILLNLIVTLPLTLVVNILYFIGLKYSVIFLLWNVVISFIYCLLAGVLGLLINLYLPKLEWSTPTAVVKQSASVLINMLITFATLALPVAAYILLDIKNIAIFLTVILVVLVVVLVGSWIILNKEGVKKFRKL